MNKKAQKLDKIIRATYASVLTLAAALLGFIFVGLCVRGVRHHISGDNELTFVEALSFIAALGVFSGYCSWRLWRGSIASNGVTLMPTWFVQTFGAFLLAGIAYAGYCNSSWWVVVIGAVVAYGVLHYPASLAEARRRRDHGS